MFKLHFAETQEMCDRNFFKEAILFFEQEAVAG